jgi:hypothetical protein
MLKDIAKLGLSSPWRGDREVRLSGVKTSSSTSFSQGEGAVLLCNAGLIALPHPRLKHCSPATKKLKCLDLIACKIFYSSAAFSAGRMTGDETKVEQRENRCASGDVDK